MNKPESINRELAIETIQSITAKVLEAPDISAPTREIYQLATDHNVGALRIIPALPVRPIYRGSCEKKKSILGYTYYACSLCAAVFRMYEDDLPPAGMKYCPACGALMEVEE